MEKSQRICLRTTVWVLCCWGGGWASAAPLTFYFEGNIDFIHDYLDLDESVYIDAPFSGNYTFDPVGVSDYYPDNPRVGLYQFGASGRLSARIGNYDFVTNDLSILIWNNVISEDQYDAGTASFFEAAGMQWSGMTVVLADLTGSALDSDALPTGVPDLSDFPSFTGLVLYLPGNDAGIVGTLTSLTPEPSSLAVLSLGAVILVARRRPYQRR